MRTQLVNHECNHECSIPPRSAAVTRSSCNLPSATANPRQPASAHVHGEPASTWLGRWAAGLIIGADSVCRAIYPNALRKLHEVLAKRHVGVLHETLRIPVGDKDELQGHLVTPAGFRPAHDLTVLFVSGSGLPVEVHAGGQDGIIDTYLTMGMRVMAFNFRGFGASTASPPSAKSLYEDAHAAAAYLLGATHLAPASRLIVHGYSLGAPLAADLVDCSATLAGRVTALVLDRPMTSAPEVAAIRMPFGLRSLAAALARRAVGDMSVRDALCKVPSVVPIVVTYDTGEQGALGESLMFEIKNERRRVVGGPTGGEHADHPKAAETIRAALASVLGGDSKTV